MPFGPFPVGGDLEREIHQVKKVLGEGTDTTNQILIQTPKYPDDPSLPSNENVLTVPALNAHLKVLLAATKVTVDLYDV